jgi:hypothetical protein
LVALLELVLTLAGVAVVSIGLGLGGVQRELEAVSGVKRDVKEEVLNKCELLAVNLSHGVEG